MEARTTAFYDRVVHSVFNHLVMWVMGLVLSVLAAVLFIREPTLRDWRYALRPPHRASSELVVVYLGEDFRDSVRPDGLTPRAYLAELLGAIAHHQPRVIALDYEIRAEDSLYAVFKEAALAAENVVLPTLLNRDQSGVRPGVPPDDLRPHIHTGYADLFLRSGTSNAVSDMYLQVSGDDIPLLSSFSLAAVTAYLFPNGSPPATSDLRERLHFPAPLTVSLPINYHGFVLGKLTASSADAPSPVFNTISSDDVLQHGAALPPQAFQNKLVLIGSIYPDPTGADAFSTPLGVMQGVEVHANIISNLLSQRYLHPLGVGWTLWCSLLALAVAALSLAYLQRSHATLLMVLFLAGFLATGFILFNTQGVLLALAWPLKMGLLGFIAFLVGQVFYPFIVRTRTYETFAVVLAEEAQRDAYSVQVAAAPFEEAPCHVRTRLAKKDQLERHLKRLQRGAVDRGALEQLGERLFEILFTGEVGPLYQRALLRARTQQQGIRLSLRVDGVSLETLPWEYLYDRRQGRFLAADPDLLFARVVGSDHRAPFSRPPSRKTWRILLVLGPSTTQETGASALHDTPYQQNLLASVWEQVQQDKRISLRVDVLHPATPDALQEHLQEGVDIVHVIGHHLHRAGSTSLVLEEANGEPITVDAATLSRFLGDTTPSLVVLHSRTPVSTRPTLPLLAGALIQEEFPAVVALQYPIPDDAALLFARVFYRVFLMNGRVDVAVTRARRALLDEMGERLPSAFGSPVLLESGASPAAGQPPEKTSPKADR